MDSGASTTHHSSALLILLVGSNPLPNYLSACALRPGRIVLVYTEETKDAKDRLKSKLKEVLTGDFEDALVKDATDAAEVRRTIGPFLSCKNLGDMLLNYTGGTKVMAANARVIFHETKGIPEHASYLDEGGKSRQPCLRFDDGNSTPLADYASIPINLQTILFLHGITHTPRAPKDPAPTVDDARRILCRVLQDVPLAAALYCERERLERYGNPLKAVPEPFRSERYGLTLSQPIFPTEQLKELGNSDWRKSWFEQWYRFIGGEWLEEWVGERVRQLELKPATEITVGVNAFRGVEKAGLEVDIAVVRGHRSYFISCTTDTTKSVCKSKLFEIAVRSRHLGGDLARAALVCLAEDHITRQLQKDIDDVWGASNTTKVFGRADIREWSDCEDKMANLHSLKTWLES